MRDELLVPGVELLVSMRSVGYDFGAAIADLVDNSITAGAARVDVIGDPVDTDFVAVLDDGRGMDSATIRHALQLAGSVGDGSRDADDLGRFGLGLKTASLSQARQLTVASSRDGDVQALQWDIDHVRRTNKWTIRVLDDDEVAALPHIHRLRDASTGTLVVWRELDLLLGSELDRRKAMARYLEQLREHLALTFHRFLEGEGSAPLTIAVNGILVEPMDPFLRRNRATQKSSTEIIRIEGQEVEVSAFTLPHHSKLTAKEKRRRDLGEGMREAQGFYVYRNRRLISHGSWSGLARRSELAKQSRVRVDFPNSLDHLWKLDIKKSRAEPPAALKRRLADLLESVTGLSARVHTFRARKDPQLDPLERLWLRHNGRGTYWYEVNVDHTAIRALVSQLDDEQRKLLDAVFSDLADGYPVEDLYASVAKNEAPAARPFDEDDVVQRLRSLRATGAMPAHAKTAFGLLRNVEPFDRTPDLERLVEVAWAED